MAYHERSGYGAFKVGKKTVGAHRVAWEIVNGPIPAGLFVRHFVCNNPLCCNVEHLRLGTPADNVADMMSSGRHNNAPNTTTPYVRPPIAKRFYARISETPTESGCLEWLGSFDKNGYGFLSVGNKNAFAHRIAWTLVNGPIPDGMVIAHHCDNPRCCRIEHLFCCTQIDNIHDMNAKRRNSPPPMHLGEGNHKAKLTAEQVMEIRSGKFAGWGQHRIAQHFGISQVQVGNILNRTSWAHLDPNQDVPRENLVARGEQSGKAKLTDRDVLAIRSDLYKDWTLDAIGEHFGISGKQVSSILRRKSWTHLDAPCENDPIKGKRDLRRKLTAEQVLEIRSDLYSEWTRVDIARHFGILQAQVGKILRRESWAHI
jgi:hypothetical protein